MPCSPCLADYSYILPHTEGMSTTTEACNIAVDRILKSAIIYATGMRGIYYSRFAQFVNQNFPIF